MKKLFLLFAMTWSCFSVSQTYAMNVPTGEPNRAVEVLSFFRMPKEIRQACDQRGWNTDSCMFLRKLFYCVYACNVGNDSQGKISAEQYCRRVFSKEELEMPARWLIREHTERIIQDPFKNPHGIADQVLRALSDLKKEEGK